MYLPKSKYEIKSSPGNEYVTGDGTPYRGFVIITYRGEVYEGDRLRNIGQRLFTVQEYQEAQKSESPLLYNTYPKPTERDYSNGVFVRYFCIDNRNKKIYEVDQKIQKQFLKYKYISTTSVDWNIIGPVEDTILESYIFRGTGSKNQKLIDDLEAQYPGFKDFLSPEQFVR